MIQESKAITGFILNHPEHYGRIRKIAALTVGCSAFKACQKLHSVVEANSCLKGNMCYGVGSNRIFVFIGDEQSIIQKLIEIRPKKRVRTPQSVVIKMIALRIRRLDDCINIMNTHIENQNKWYRDNHMPGHIEPLIDKLTLSDIDDIMHSRSRLLNVDRRVMTDLLSILNRTNPSSDIIKKAWDLYGVESVMRS